MVSLIVVADGEDRVGVDGGEGERELVLRGFAAIAVVVLVHQVAGQVGDVGADGNAIAPRSVCAANDDAVLVAADQSHARRRDRAGRTRDGDVVGRERPAGGREVDRLVERHRGGIERRRAQVHQRRRRAGRDSRAGGVEGDRQARRVGAFGRCRRSCGR